MKARQDTQGKRQYYQINFKLYDDLPLDKKIVEFLNNQENRARTSAIKLAIATYINAMGTTDIFQSMVGSTKNVDLTKARDDATKALNQKAQSASTDNVSRQPVERVNKSTNHTSDNSSKRVSDVSGEEPIPQDIMDEAWDAELLRSDIK